MTAFSLTVQTIDDTYLRSRAHDDTNFGTETDIVVKDVPGAWNGTDFDRVGLVRFPLLGVPTGATITSATLYGYWTGAYSGDCTVRAFPCLRAWTEAGATFNRYDGSNAWGSVGASNSTTDYDGTNELANHALSGNPGGAGTELAFASVGLVAHCQDNVGGEISLLLKGDADEDEPFTIYSSDHATAAYHPTLVIEYEYTAPVWRPHHWEDCRLELIDSSLDTIGLLDEARLFDFDWATHGLGEGGSFALHIDSDYLDDLVSDEQFYFRLYIDGTHIADYMLLKDDHGYTVTDQYVDEYVTINLASLDTLFMDKLCLPETASGHFDTPSLPYDDGMKWVVDHVCGPNAYADPVDASARVVTGMTVDGDDSAHGTTAVITEAHKQELYKFLRDYGQNWGIDWRLRLEPTTGKANQFVFETFVPTRGLDKTETNGARAPVILNDASAEVRSARRYREWRFKNVVFGKSLAAKSADATSVTAHGRREVLAGEDDPEALDALLAERSQRTGDEFEASPSEMCEPITDYVPGDEITYSNNHLSIASRDDYVKALHGTITDEGWLDWKVTVGRPEKGLGDIIKESGGGGGSGSQYWDPIMALRVDQPDAAPDVDVPFADDDPTYVRLTSNVGIAFTPTVNVNQIAVDLKHLGIESLADPGADRIMFWDNSETATKWLTPNTGLSISTTNLNLANTAVTPGAYGDATHVGQFTVDQQGRLTAAASVAIDLSATYITGVTAGNGLTGGGSAGDVTVTLGTPGTLTVATNNAVTADSHTHAITSSANPGAAASILASEEHGYLTILRLYVLDSNVLLDGGEGIATLSGLNGVSLQHNSTEVVSITTTAVVSGANNTYPLGVADNRWTNVCSVAGNFTGDVTIGTGVGIIHADSVAAGKVLRADGARYIPADIQAADIAHNLLSTYHGDTATATVQQGDIIKGDATPRWQRLAIGVENSLLACNGTDPSWDATPTVTSLTTTGNIVVEGQTLYLGAAGTNVYGTGLVMRLMGGGQLNFAPTATNRYFMTEAALAPSDNSRALGGGEQRWSTVYGVAGNFTGDITIGTAKGIVLADGNETTKVLTGTGARYVGNASPSLTGLTVTTLTVNGHIVVTGNVDGVDVSALKIAYDAHGHDVTGNTDSGQPAGPINVRDSNNTYDAWMMYRDANPSMTHVLCSDDGADTGKAWIPIVWQVPEINPAAIAHAHGVDIGSSTPT